MIDTNYRRDVKLFGIQSSCPTRTVPHRKCQAASVRFPAAIVQIMVQKMVQKRAKMVVALVAEKGADGLRSTRN